MAYENMTYEFILQRMMNRVTEKYPDLDNREGSMLFNALAPAAVELAIMYTTLDNALGESFVRTASREYLLLACEQMGMDISKFEASAGTHRVQFNERVPIGSRWNCELYNYTVTEYIGIEEALYTYHAVCDTVGAAPNNQTGELTPITDFINNLTVANVVKCLIEGEDETPDDDIRTAYEEYVGNSVAEGNINQYRRWCSDYNGIGNYKIIPLWNGANTVKVSILSSSNRSASEELVAEFQEYLDPKAEGMGNGVAPIGAFVTVSTATELPISVSATVTMKSGYTDTTPIDNALVKYLSEIAYEKTMVAYMNLGAVILDVEGVESVSDLKINGGTTDVMLEAEQIPVFETGSWVVN